MSLHPQTTYPIPEETQRVARAAFPRGHIYMQVADHLGTIYHDAQFAALFPTRGQPAEAPALPKASPIAKPPMPSAAALIGNTSSDWPSPILASTIPS